MEITGLLAVKMSSLRYFKINIAAIEKFVSGQVLAGNKAVKNSFPNFILLHFYKQIPLHLN